ncbi:outer membrane beta-barrel protein [Spirosoma agri]|uniref:Porin family protein n=1 Tax=Spirosoma agri TaxID=1987381 RepID=A0A6M0IQ52_9BACT|nr:outer membrane beta-barrel protein [Spirosoma agri]NEU70416.1 porin family protein [Spirosoma agri]
MRRYLLLFCLVSPLVGKTQTLSDGKQQDLLGKGHFNVGVNVGQGYRGTYPTTTYVIPRVQYFIMDGWSIAAEARYLVSNIYPQTVDKPDYRLKGGGLSTRYYFLRGNRLAMFGHLGASYGQSTLRMRSDAPPGTGYTWQTEIGLGAHYRIAKRWSVEAMAGRSWSRNSNGGYYLTPPDDFNRWQVSVGINFRLK